MRIGFFGTPDLAARVLSDLGERHEVIFAVTAPDRPAGRKLELHACPAKAEALRRGIPVIQPESLKGPSVREDICSRDADIFVVVAYGSLIPLEIFDHPPLKTINLHPSLLPKYRGAAPMQWCLIHGESETGISVQVINERLDAGDIIVQERIALDGDMSTYDLAAVVFSRGAELLDRAMKNLAAGTGSRIIQDESLATYCGKIDRNTALIDWGRGSLEIHNLVRGLNPKPAAFSTFRGENIKIWKTALFREDMPAAARPGTLAAYRKKRLIAGTGDGYIEIISIQPANKKVMDGLSFINGYRLAGEDRFE